MTYEGENNNKGAGHCHQCDADRNGGTDRIPRSERMAVSRCDCSSIYDAVQDTYRHHAHDSEGGEK